MRRFSVATVATAYEAAYRRMLADDKAYGMKHESPIVLRSTKRGSSLESRSLLLLTQGDNRDNVRDKVGGGVPPTFNDGWKVRGAGTLRTPAFDVPNTKRHSR